MRTLLSMFLILALCTTAWAAGNATLGTLNMGTDVELREGLIHNHDGTFENGVIWQNAGVAPPDYGAFAECFDLSEQQVIDARAVTSELILVLQRRGFKACREKVRQQLKELLIGHAFLEPFRSVREGFNETCGICLFVESRRLQVGDQVLDLFQLQRQRDIPGRDVYARARESRVREFLKPSSARRRFRDYMHSVEFMSIF